jgi:hypothetical protein
MRLTSLLRTFDLPLESVTQQDRKSVIASVRAEYLRRAKEEHPDLAPTEKKDEASQKFKKLHEEFTETTQLLEDGVRPGVFVPPSGQETTSQTIRRPFSHPISPEKSEPGPRYPVTKTPEFDMATRIKCNLIFWSGLFVFMMGMREFLVWSAGSTYAWSRPANLNPFWIRRFQNEWVDDAAKERSSLSKAEMKAKVQEKVKKLEVKKDRGVDEFYQKRRISNVKRKYTPRGSTSGQSL